jgi:hypothetical protein
MKKEINFLNWQEAAAALQIPMKMCSWNIVETTVTLEMSKKPQSSLATTRYSSFLLGLAVQIFVPDSVDVDDVDVC